MILQSRMEKVLIIGSGAREHAIAKSLEKSKHPKMIYCLATNMNPGIAEICEEILIGNINDNHFVCDYGKEIGATIAIVGPENPLARGVSDSLWDNNIPVVGPKKDLAQVET
jgi:phosphoribosylamine--glycine ligase